MSEFQKRLKRERLINFSREIIILEFRDMIMIQSMKRGKKSFNVFSYYYLELFRVTSKEVLLGFVQLDIVVVHTSEPTTFLFSFYI